MTAKQLIWRFLTEPFVHFLCLGLLLFVVYRAIDRGDSADDSNRIVVVDDALIDFLRFRSKSVAAESLTAVYQSLSAAELQRLVDEFVRHEALYREAQALGLDQHNFAARQRLISQLEFVHQGIVGSAIELGDDDLMAYLQARESHYREPATITFTHVFLSSQLHGDDDASRRAEEMLERLRAADGGDPVAFHQAPAYGDRFLYHQNYVNREAGLISSHFGGPMQQQLFALDPQPTTWRGPFRSPYGYHLVLLTGQTDAYLPSFDELRDRLRIDAHQSQLERQLQQLEQAIVQRYHVEFDGTLGARLDPSRTGVVLQRSPSPLSPGLGTAE